jgi:flagellar hook-length control protein FliK
MRAAAAGTPSSAAGALALADAKVTGNGAGAAAPQTSSTAAASDRGADSSQDGTSGQPFAAALASAQADTDRKPGTRAATVPVGLEGPSAGPKTLQRSPAARLDSRAQAGSASGEGALEAGPEAASPLSSVVAPGDSAAETPLVLAGAAGSSVDSAAAMEDPSPKIDGAGDASGTAPKPRAGKHSQTADALGGAALATLATMLSAAAAQISAAAPATPGTASSTLRSSGSGADANSALGDLAVAGKQPLPRGLPAESTASSSPLIGPATAAPATSGAESNGAIADALVPARAAEASTSSASTAAGLAPVMQGLSAVTNAASASATASVGVPVSHSSWPSALATQVQWMATRQLQSATLRLSPEHLGPLEVRIDVTNSQINVNFTAHHPDTREALAQAVPQLRQLFAAGGLNLGEASVRQESGSSEQPLRPQPSSAAAGSETVEPVANTTFQRLGLVDEYA